MMRAPEGTSDLGGISTMLINADVCPSCGEVHSEPRFLGIPIRLPGSRTCPVSDDEPGPTLSHALAVAGPAPTFALPEVESIPDEIELTVRSRDAEVAAPWPVPSGVF